MRALVLAVSAVVLAVVVACSGKPACSAATCGTCCSEAGECLAATTDQACGAAGNMCAPRETGFQCRSGRCERGGTGGGAAGGSGGGTAGAGGASGGSTAGGSGGASGGSAGGAAGGTSGVTCGTGPTAPTIPISFPAACTAPTACGGNPSGMFFYTSACIPQSEFTSFVTRIEQGMGGAGCGAGSVTVRGYDGGMSGYAFFDGGTVCRAVTGAVTVFATISGVCAIPQACNLINGNIMGYQASCFVDGGLCDCTVTSAININNGAHFTTGPTTLTVLGTNQTFETCLAGGTNFSTRELDAGTAVHEPGVAGLTKQ